MNRRRFRVLITSATILSVIAVAGLNLFQGRRMSQLEYRSHVASYIHETQVERIPTSIHGYKSNIHYQALVKSGKPIVPYLLHDLQDGRRMYVLWLLDDILDLDLGARYGDPEWQKDPDRCRLHWLRWWEESGSNLNW